ncbi:MAG: phosphonoacetaldehyde reductase [Planctomycetes bacterium]|nr:phosphonoacetaldehyde reductase [Planctomycetota bacterium]
MLQDFVGFGSLEECFAALTRENFRKILVVASKSGWQRFNSAGPRLFFQSRKVQLFQEFEYNPEFREILAGVEVLQSFCPDLIVALGGGSAMDVAKMMKAAAYSREPYDSDNPDTVKPSGDGPPLVAIATTAGSGSEATRFAVFYHNAIKHSQAHPSLRPEAAVVDPELTYSLPPDQTASTGLDALAQAVEAYWASSSTPEAKELAAAAIKYALPNLKPAVDNPQPANRYHMGMAAYLSGKAIDITRTTFPHTLCYHLTKRYGVPHGHACALTMPFFFRINVDPRVEILTPAGPEGHRKNMAELAALFGQNKAEDVFPILRALMKAVGLRSTLAEVGVTSREQMTELVNSVNMTRIRNHPVALQPEFLIDYLLEHDKE